METIIEVDVPIEGKEVVFDEGVKFKKSFSMQPLHNRNVAAQITANGLKGFSVRLFKAIDKRRTKDGAPYFSSVVTRGLLRAFDAPFESTLLQSRTYVCDIYDFYNVY